jgi:hypothetical protein
MRYLIIEPDQSPYWVNGELKEAEKSAANLGDLTIYQISAGNIAMSVVGDDSWVDVEFKGEED